MHAFDSASTLLTLKSQKHGPPNDLASLGRLYRSAIRANIALKHRDGITTVVKEIHRRVSPRSRDSADVPVWPKTLWNNL